MILRIYLDDCAYSKTLVQFLQKAGHDVLTPADAGTTGFADDFHLRRASDESRVLITKDVDDFAALHQNDPAHSGILGIYQYNDPSKDMSAADIVNAIGNLVQAGVPIPGNYWILNQWQF